MAKKQGNIVLRHLKQIKTGVDRPGYNATRRNECAKAIDKALRTPNLNKLLDVAVELDSLSIVEGAKGVVEIWEGETEGWTHLQSSFACMSWNVRICVGLFRRGLLKAGWSFTHLNLAARCLAHAIATKQDVFADWCGQMLLDNFATGEGLYNSWPSPFEPFMVVLFAQWKGLSNPALARPHLLLGVYQEVLETWGKETFPAAVARACDYHVERSVEGRTGDAEFVRIPHNVFPAEILAVKRIRDETGLAWPTLDHSLLDTPLAQLPLSLPFISNDLLDRLAGAVRSLIPEVAPPQDRQ